MEGFWQNIGRYFQFFIAIVLGVFLNAMQPLVPLFRRPLTAIALVTALVATLVFFTLTLQAMLGLSGLT